MTHVEVNICTVHMLALTLPNRLNRLTICLPINLGVGVDGYRFFLLATAKNVLILQMIALQMAFSNADHLFGFE